MHTLSEFVAQMTPYWADWEERWTAWSDGGSCQCAGCMGARKMTLGALCGRGKLDVMPIGHVHPLFLGFDWARG